MVDVAASGMAKSLAAPERSVRMLETLVAADPNKLSVKIQLARAEEYTGHRLRGLGRYAEAIAGYRRSMALADSMLEADPTSHVALAEAVASGRGMATAMAMAGDRAGSLRQARATIERAQAGVNAGAGQTEPATPCGREHNGVGFGLRDPGETVVGLPRAPGLGSRALCAPPSDLPVGFGDGRWQADVDRYNRSATRQKPAGRGRGALVSFSTEPPATLRHMSSAGS